MVTKRKHKQKTNDRRLRQVLTGALISIVLIGAIPAVCAAAWVVGYWLEREGYRPIIQTEINRQCPHVDAEVDMDHFFNDPIIIYNSQEVDCELYRSDWECSCPTPTPEAASQ